jgi:hypothetical protein
MLVEPARKSANPNVELVKSIMEKHLQKPADDK